MTFKEATDSLFTAISHQKLAKALDVSVASIRQARLRQTAKAYRSPPDNWRRAVIRLAEEQIWHYRRLIEALMEEANE